LRYNCAEDLIGEIFAHPSENNQLGALLKQSMDKNITILQLLAYLLSKKGSDLHLRVGLPPIMRISGDIKAYSQKALREGGDIRILMQELLGQEQFHNFEIGTQSRFLVHPEGLGSFEVQLTNMKGQLAASIRALPTRTPTLDDLKAPEIFWRITTDFPTGLILINGKVGSGRTTTMAAIRNEILNTQECHVVSLSSDCFTNQESLKGLHSSMIVGAGYDVDSYDEAFKCALKMDPDYIFIMEHLDNLSTSEIRRVLDLARFGFCVVASVYADSTETALRQLVGQIDYRDREFAQDKLASVLRVSICQRLLRTMDNGGRVACYEIFRILPDMRPAIANLDLDRISRILASHSESISMKRAAKVLLEGRVIDALEFERV
jgi:twitching motility protein PilT